MPLITTTSAASARGFGFCRAIGARTTPISGYELWLDSSDASKFTYSSGSVISSWTDKSANAYVFEPSSTTYAPTRTGTQNSKSTVVFDGTDDFLTSTASASTWKFLHDGTESTSIVVYKNTRVATGTGDDYRVLLDTTGYEFSSISAAYQGYTLRSKEWYYSGSYYSEVGNVINSGVIPSGQTYPSYVSNTDYLNPALRNTWNVNVNLIDPNNATTANKILTYDSQSSFPNSPGTSISGNGWTTASTSAPPTPLRIGWWRAGAYYPAFQGEIAEIILYKRKLSVAEKTEMTTYLKNKWNI